MASTLLDRFIAVLNRSRLATATLVSALVFGIFIASPVAFYSDPIWSIHTSMSLLRGQNGNLVEYRHVIEDKQRLYIEAHGDRLYNMFPVGVSVMAMPAVLAASTIYPKLHDDLKWAIPTQLQKYIACAIAAAAAGVFCLFIVSTFQSVPIALISTIILCFCTSMWSQASRTLWQHGPVVLMFSLTLLLMAWARHRPWIIQFAGATLAFAFICRPTAAIPIAVISLYVLIRHLRWAPLFFGWAAITTAPWFAYNWSINHTWFTEYYLPSRIVRTSTFWTAIAGNLISPARGLIIYSPILIAAIPGFWIAMRKSESRDFAIISAAIIVLHLIVISRFPHWWAGHSYGTRFMTDVLPFCIYLVAHLLQELPHWTRPWRVGTIGAMLTLGAISVFMHGQGAIHFDVHLWNSTPVNVDIVPQRLWDWHDLAFLRGLS
ncbi:hypothetical protein NML43_23855 [Rhodopseudomonas palustris]|uniref:hypothetical protein n=1 Tax=Rhodopseudomonas palustris TaxID=1076 RepID=UPI0020CB8519|nr:hypothetical protein [Rhodopseudomonas palustris]MCP9630138.1 hypothetical protein [Rhodopseudomonas palustris]